MDYQNETNLQRFSDRELEYLTLSSLRANKQWTAEKCVCVKKRHVGAAQNERGGYPFKFAPRFLTIKSSEDLFASKDDGRFLLSVFQHTNRYGYTNYRYSVKVLVHHQVSHRPALEDLALRVASEFNITAEFLKNSLTLDNVELKENGSYSSVFMHRPK